MRLKGLESIRLHYDHVYLSPHFDDVAASCGGEILNQRRSGESVLVVSVFTANPRDRERPEHTSLENILDFKTRRREDIQAMNRLGADFLWLDYPDSIFRLNKPLKRYWPYLPESRPNRTLHNRLLADLSDLCNRSGCSTLSLPLGIGQHVDHQILYRAGTALFHSHRNDLKFFLYEDYPYVFFPFLFNYRMNRTGIAFSRRKSGEILETDTPVFGDTKFAFDIITAIPSLQLNRRSLKPMLYATLLLFHLLVKYLLRPRPGELKGITIHQKITDISSTIDGKMHAVTAYGSQLSHPFRDRDRVAAVMEKYSRSIGSDRGRYLERSWELHSHA